MKYFSKNNENEKKSNQKGGFKNVYDKLKYFKQYQIHKFSCTKNMKMFYALA